MHRPQVHRQVANKCAVALDRQGQKIVSLSEHGVLGAIFEVLE